MNIISYIKHNIFKTPFISSFLLGGFTVIALPPYYLFWILFFTIPLFLHLILNAKNLKKAFFIGQLFGFGYFLIGLYWLYFTLYTYFGRFNLVIPIGVISISYLLSFYFAFISSLTYSLRGNRIFAWIMFISSCIVSDWLRGKLFSGFGWNYLGYALDTNLPIMQLASLTGIYGVTLLLVTIATLPWIVFSTRLHSLLKLLLICLISISTYLIYTFGDARLEANNTEYHNVNIRIIQADVDQSIRWDKDLAFEHVNNMVELSKGDDKEQFNKIDLFIWPETAVPFYLSDNEEYNKAITQIMTNSFLNTNQLLLTGIVRYTGNKKNNLHLYNSLAIINHDSKILDFYDKSHLVPFGEYIPFRQFVPFDLSKLTDELMDLTSGKQGNITMKIQENIPSFSPLICYEIIFPNEVVNEYTRPEWLLNITNDGWFAETSGPYQHYVIAKTRTIEEGLPLVRVANKGISAVIDSLGREIKYIDLDQKGFIDSQLPKSLNNPTFYAQYGDWLIYVLATIIILLQLIRPKIDDQNN